MKYTVNTKYNQDMIEFETHSNDLQGIANRISTEVVNLKNEAINEALSKLGYLSPTDKSEVISAINNLAIAYRTVVGLEGAYDDCLVKAEKLLKKWGV